MPSDALALHVNTIHSGYYKRRELSSVEWFLQPIYLYPANENVLSIGIEEVVTIIKSSCTKSYFVYSHEHLHFLVPLSNIALII